ncbi:NINE protein [Haloarchaeobius sp. TZWWS8]|uniref:NINE protein n=1 Tax=Haloarchaeobius sp. TZWWS8 TaxID=3446121 RepID=UPI003EBC5C2C
MVAILLAIFFGIFGIHRIYLGELKKGILYFVFSWTAIPWLLGLYDAYKYATNKEAFENSPEAIAVSEPASIDSQRGADKTSDVTADVGDGLMAIKGVNGKVTLYDDRLEISREGIGMLHKMQHGFKGDKEIPYESITSIQLRKPSSVTRGYIQFGQSGFSESDDGLLDATSDENTVLFEKESLSGFQELRSKVRDLKKGDVKESTGSMDGAMETLRKRYAEGDIDEEEYNKRKDILQQ